ncbi:MAG: glycosyl transferase family 2 [Tissierellia bacterium]|nr:glycosyl transferase family 2 [Tissierellia bacterium]
MKLSVIVPVYKENPEKFIKNFEIFNDAEIIFSVADQKTYNALKKTKYKVIKSKKGRGTQLHNGFLNSNSKYLLFMHSDCFFRQDPTDEITRILKDYEIGAFSIDFNNGFLMKIAAAMSSFRIDFRNIAFGDQGLFMKRSFYEKMGGFKDISLMEDYDFSIRVKKENIKIKRSRQKIYADDRRLKKMGILKSIFTMQKCQYIYRHTKNYKKCEEIYYTRRQK